MRVRVNGQDGSAIHPVATLFLGSGAVAVFVALANAAWLAWSTGLSRLRELELARLIHRFMAKIDLDLYEVLPVIVSKPFDLTNATSFFSFLSLAIIVNLFFIWALAVLLFPVVAATARMFPRDPNNQLATWFWGSTYPLVVLVGFALPPSFHLVHYDLLHRAHWGKSVGVMIVIAAVVWFGLLAMFRRPREVERFFKVCTVSSLAVVILSLSGGVVATVLESTASQSVQSAPAPGLPNILLISIDSLRADHLHCYGYPRETSPTIDALAEEGTLFRTVISPTSWTLPAHLTLLTSLPPERHGVVNDSMRLRPEALTLAEVLRQAGYETAGFVSGPYLETEYGFAQGFDQYDDYSVSKPGEFSHRGSTSPKLLRLTQEWLTQWNKGGRQHPFFIFLHMWDVHYDYTPPPPYDSLFDPDYQGVITGEDFEMGPQVHKDMDPRDLEHVIALYDGEIRYTDSYLKQVLNILKTLKVFDDTITIVTSDHGDEFFEHEQKGHGKTLYDETIMVPLVIRFPGKVPMGKTVEHQARLMDVAPTILELAGVSRPTGFGTTEPHGRHSARDLTPLMIEVSTAAAPALPAFSDLQRQRYTKLASLRTKTFKLIKHLETPPTYELYDLLADPAEQVNLIGIGSKPILAEALLKELTAWREFQRGGRDFSRKFELSEEQKESLRSLGYIE